MQITGASIELIDPTNFPPKAATWPVAQTIATGKKM